MVGKPGKSLLTPWSDDSQQSINQLWDEIEARFGICPSFFKLAHYEPPVARNLFRQAEFAYLDNPIPALFKERLFTWLSRFCDARYCVARHCAFLLGRGRLAGDAGAPPLSAEQALSLLKELMPDKEELPEYLRALEETPAPLGEWPDFDSDLGRRFRVACAVTFLDPGQAAPWLRELLRLLGPSRYEQLMVFLAFVRTAHFWTQVHPELEFEPDLEAMLSEREALVEPLLRGADEAVRRELGQQLHDDVWSLRESRKMAEALRVSEERLELIINSLPAQIAYVGRDQRYIFVNRAYGEQFRLDASAVIGRTVCEVLGEENFRAAQPHLEAALRGEERRYELDLSAPDNGEPRRKEVTYVPHRLDNGSIAGCFSLIIDITERARAAEDERLLSEIGERIRLEESEGALLEAVTRAVGKHLGVARCFFVEVDEANDRGSVRHDYRRGEPSAAGEYRLSDYSSRLLSEVRAGRTVIIYDAKSDPRTADLYERVYAPLGERACVIIPLRREGRWVGTLWASSPEPRQWQTREVVLLETVAERSWNAVEKMRLDVELRASEERFRILADMAPVMIWSAGIDKLRTFFNKPWLDFTGRAMEEELGGGWTKGIHPEDYDRCLETYFTSFEAREPFKMEYRLLRHDGEYRWIADHGVPRFSPGGDFLGYIGSCIDITERKKVEEALRESEQRFARFMRHLPGLAWIKDLQGRYVYANAAAVNAFRTPPEELYGRTDDEVFPLEVATQFKENDQRALTNEEGVFVVETLEHEDAVLHYSAVRKFPIPGQDGKETNIGGIAIDITESKRADEALRESEGRLAGIVSSAMDAIITVDEDHRIVVFNEAAERMFGCPAAEALGQPLNLFIPERFRNSHAEHVRHFGETGGASRATGRLSAFAGLRADGTEFPIEAAISSVEVGGRKLYTVIHRDITERKQAEAEREQLAREQVARAAAEAANRSKDEFLAMVSHELRSPLNAILGYTRMLRSGPVDRDAVNNITAVVERSAKAQLQIIEDLLDSSRIVAGKLRIEPEPVDLVPALQAALDTVRSAAEAKGVSLVADFGPLPEEALGDATRLQQVVWNLLTNAVKFTPEGGRVELRMEGDADIIRITVSDTGKGIEPEFLPFVFDRFRQADPSSARRYGGLGLGLSLVKHLVELHGGTITAESEGAGKGSTFTVTLPRRHLEFIPPPPAVRPGEVRTEDAITMDRDLSLDGVSVLIVDDQVEARELLTRALGNYGAQVTAVSSGVEALAFLSDPPGGERPDALILDIAMPDEDGYAVLKKVRELEAAQGAEADQIPAIALTAYGRSEDRLRALQEGFQMHVAKPVEPAELAVVIESLTSRRAWDRRRK
jgi:PAS domain S-box-containing protein